jgi:hypothetical protein
MVRLGLVFAALLILIPLMARADNLVVNADFELPLEPAWTSTSSGECTIERDTSLDPDPDYEAHIVLSGLGHGRLLQVVEVLDTEIDFSVILKLHADATGEAWAGAAIVLTYLDDTQAFLGETLLGAWTHECPWENGPTEHLVSLPADEWMDWTLNINDDLQELPAVDPLAVRYIRVALNAQAYEC